MRPLVYVAHPLAGDWEGNIASAREYTERFARTGFAPVAPYLTLYGLLHEPADRTIGLDIDAAAIVRCDVVIVCGRTITPGMEQEIDIARRAFIPVRQILSPDVIDTNLLDVVLADMERRRLKARR
jgi:hypothetical protein